MNSSIFLGLIPEDGPISPELFISCDSCPVRCMSYFEGRLVLKDHCRVFPVGDDDTIVDI